ncbi:hypothetical protein OEZ86_006861 [Tetradesmus obliquus]|nr:hypothetical protein OEZ86_006861 [Tetradesmus obliquus]
MPNTSREDIKKEVQTVLSMRIPSLNLQKNQQTSSQALQKIAPGTPQTSQQHGLAHDSNNIIIQSSLDAKSVKDEDAVKDTAIAIKGEDAQSSSGGVGRQWVAHAAESDDGKHTRASQLRSALKSLQQVLRAHPYIWVVSLLVTVVLMAAGVLGVLAAAQTETRHRKDSASGFANNAAVGFTVQLQQTFAPLSALQAIIHFEPDYSKLAPRFDQLAQELLSQLPVPGSVASLQMTPQGVVRSFYPLKGNEAALNHNLFRDPQRRAASLETIARGELTMQGPVTLLQGWRGAVARLPVFIVNVSANETFNAPDVVYDCPICCNETTRTKFWGFVSCIVKLQDLATGSDARLVNLTDMGYNYEFFAPQPDSEPIMIAASPQRPIDPVKALVEVPNNEWSLLVAPQQGWVPRWRNPMLAAVVVVVVILGLLIMATLVSRAQQLWLLKEMRVSNQALADEKARTDVLLARQYNLIGLMAQQGLFGSSSGCSASALHEKTLDQIESMRRSMGAASFSAGGDQLQLLELLGEGTFGKVYKGVWRGSTVAIKTMILPAKMSGAEKRERMAIMEAAISSVMNHPNIVQTYTYTIKPATSTATAQQQASSASGALSDGGGAASPSPRPAGAAAAEGEGSGAGNFDGDSNVHSFEVNIVLEYCDWGCLRDALDAGAFYSGGSLNYAAILDTAADVAKAMLHLHCNQVLHSDLKVRNVLLKSDGSSERGCMAKVADFGLAVKLELNHTHVSAFQGTMSHMAPEVMLQGRISKAADVYSFGITLWDLFTGGHAYHGIPKALLGHQVAVCGLRPAFPDFTPSEYRALAEACWQAEPERRPSFQEILATLQRMRARVGGHTPPMAQYTPGLASAQRSQDGAAASASPGVTTLDTRVAAAADAGLVQMTSFYLDNSMSASDAQAGGSLAHLQGNHAEHGSSSASSGLLPVPPVQPHQQQQQMQQHLQQQAAAAAGVYTRVGASKGSTKLPPISDGPEEA